MVFMQSDRLFNILSRVQQWTWKGSLLSAASWLIDRLENIYIIIIIIFLLESDRRLLWTYTMNSLISSHRELMLTASLLPTLSGK